MNKNVLKLGGIILLGAGTAFAYLQYQKKKAESAQQEETDVTPPESQE